MRVEDLLQDADREGDADGRLLLKFATRTVDDVELPPGRVQVSDVGALQVDPVGEDVDLLPTTFMTTPGPCLSVCDVRALVQARPEVASYRLNGVLGFKHLADGGNAQRMMDAMGSFLPPDGGEIWVLLSPESQWPAHWFSGSAD